MHFHCFYTAFASLQAELDCDVNSCVKHVTKVVLRNNGVIRDVLLFDFDVVLAMISTMVPQALDHLQSSQFLPCFSLWAVFRSRAVTPD